MAFQKIGNPKRGFGNFFQSINCLAAWENLENDTPGSRFLGGFPGKTWKMTSWKSTFFFSMWLIVLGGDKIENPKPNFFISIINCSGGSKD